MAFPPCGFAHGRLWQKAVDVHMYMWLLQHGLRCKQKRSCSCDTDTDIDTHNAQLDGIRTCMIPMIRLYAWCWLRVIAFGGSISAC